MWKEKVKDLTRENNALKHENNDLKIRFKRMQKLLQERNDTINELRDKMYGSKDRYNRSVCRNDV